MTVYDAHSTNGDKSEWKTVCDQLVKTAKLELGRDNAPGHYFQENICAISHRYTILIIINVGLLTLFRSTQFILLIKTLYAYLTQIYFLISYFISNIFSINPLSLDE